jgi:hypothetical protein
MFAFAIEVWFFWKLKKFTAKIWQEGYLLIDQDM